MTTEQKLTKKQRRLLRQQGVIVNTGITGVKTITPLTFNQKQAFKHYKNDKNLMLHGMAGTGKTFVSLYLALNSLLSSEKYKKVIVVRSVVPSREIGFLPGTQKEKTKVYELPYHGICAELFQRSDAYDILKQKGQIEFLTTSFIRGLTINDAIFVIDECQNMTWQEITTILTRVGQNCRVLICGDTRQSDLTDKTGKRDLLKLINVCRNMKSFEFIQMGIDDIVRSGFCKQFLIECENLGY